jgi:acyl-[acyl-carrier-protein]-phospholipid O-acyltransferase/long-chain-fatty-acid--[acyl-carrier-protein] ligase
MSRDLWKGRRFVPLLITQFLGAFNDNLFKNTLMTFVAFKLVADAKVVGMYSNLIAGIFILPYFLFSALAGILADKYNRAVLVRRLKEIELALMAIAGAVFMLKSPVLLIIVLFFMGMQSTFFGPIKYALLPQLLHDDELVDGNAYVEASTYISIILGSVMGTILPISVSTILLLVCAVGGVVAGRKIPDAPGVQPDLKVDFNIKRQIKENIALIRSHIVVYRTIIGATWFWVLGAFFLAELFPLCSKVFNTQESVVTLFLVLFSLGVGVGSVCCGKLLKGEVSIVYVPISAVGLSVCAFAVYLLSVGFDAPENPLTLSEFILLPRGFGLAVFLFLFAFTGGMYIVPLNALMQKKAPKKYVASVIAGNNIINALGMAAISLVAILLISLGFKITDLFLLIAVISAGVAFYICKLLPDALIRSIFGFILHLLFRLEVHGLHNFKDAGSKTLIIANHVSLLDGVLIATFLPRKITFAIDSEWGKKWYVRLFDGLVDFYPLNPASPLAIRSLIEEVNKGKTVMIFPEGRISVTGALMKVYEGAGVIAQKTGAAIVPLRIDGAQYSKFSYLGDLIKTRMFPKIKMFILPACKIGSFEGVSARERRNLISLQMSDIMADMIYETSDKNEPVFNGLLQAERLYGTKHKIALDMAKHTLTYGNFLLKTYVLGCAYKKKLSRNDEYIGVLLPNSLACAISFFALHCAAKIPVMLNFSLGNAQFSSCLETMQLQTVLTSRRFIEQGKLERLVECMQAEHINIVYLEDFAADISLLTKLKGLKKFMLRERVTRDVNVPAVVLFTSGSEGLPKAVLLSHKNLQANVLQLRLSVPFNSKDVFLNALPMFHSFGLTVGTILPLLNGVKTCFYPSPLHYRIIPEVAYDLQATVVCGTDTFLYGYGRMAHSYDFFPIRFAVAGGEKLKERTAELWMKKFGVRVFEGYGATETAPVISVNTPMFYKEHTVGRFLPGIHYKLQAEKGIANGGRLLLRGDNVMLGYIKHDAPRILQPADKWYDTGDIVTVDDEGFIAIQGRAKRFAKIAGEMVSLSAVEQILERMYPDAKQGVLAFDDEKKGEKLVFVTSEQSADLDAVKQYFRNAGVSELWIPKQKVYMQNPPLTGTGKFDYNEVMRQLTENKEV